jgi:hypothetical protein
MTETVGFPESKRVRKRASFGAGEFDFLAI